MTEQEEIKITVPLSDILELIRLSNSIEYPNCTFLPDEPLLMADNAVRLIGQAASNIADILHRWVHDKSYYEELAKV